VKQLKIAMISWRDLAHPLAGGSEVLADRLLSGLAVRGHRVALICGGPVGQRSYRVIDAGGTYSQYANGPRKVLQMFRDVDVVIDVENGLPFFTPLWWKKPSVILMHHLHEDQWNDRFPRYLAWVARWLETRAMPWIYRNRPWVAVSSSTKDSLVGIGVPASQIHVIESGVDTTENFDPHQHQHDLFLCLGRLVPHKRVDMVIKAWLEIADTTPGTLLVAGDGPLARNVEREARLSDRIEYLGKVSEKEKLELFQRASLLVTATHHEGWGMTITEAAAQGTPTLAFDVDGARDAIEDGVTGILVQRGGVEVEHFATVWKRLASDPALLDQLGSNARKRATSLSWDRTIDLWEETLYSVTEKARLSG
jgi:glycosyltransferase involved in cell wall biosynthesis